MYDLVKAKNKNNLDKAGNEYNMMNAGNTHSSAKDRSMYIWVKAWNMTNSTTL